MSEEIIYTDSSEVTALIFGVVDAHVREIENVFGVDIRNRSAGDGDAIIVSGPSDENVQKAAEVLSRLSAEAGDHEEISEQRVAYIIGMVKDGQGAELAGLDDSVICLTSRGKPVKAKTVGQQQYVKKIGRAHV